MKLEFDNPKHEILINNYDALFKKFRKKGEQIADDLLAVIEVLRAADCLFDVPKSYRPHPLKAEYKGYFAVDVDDKNRIIFRPNHNSDPNFRIDNYKTITSIKIIEIFKDYH
ncbi:MAG: killer suppression protein HigA [Candidatus Sungbacteria bacterium]|nr:killer suppression protein HigA [Candidatus Sungbacteria bacterium]